MSSKRGYIFNKMPIISNAILIDGFFNEYKMSKNWQK